MVATDGITVVTVVAGLVRFVETIRTPAIGMTMKIRTLIFSLLLAFELFFQIPSVYAINPPTSQDSSSGAAIGAVSPDAPLIKSDQDLVVYVDQTVCQVVRDKGRPCTVVLLGSATEYYADWPVYLTWIAIHSNLATGEPVFQTAMATVLDGLDRRLVNIEWNDPRWTRGS